MPSPLPTAHTAPWGSTGRYLCHGVAWPGRIPHLALTTPDGKPVMYPLLAPTGTGAAPRLVMSALETQRYCLGWTRFSPTGARSVPCPQHAPATRGAQCEHCAAADVFRLAHHAHRLDTDDGSRGAVPAELEPYLARPHWVYVATFSDATCKVGTAVDARKVERLDEQGPARATWVVHAEDGRSARVIEDLITTHGIGQTKRHASKLAAACSPRTADAIHAAHDRAVTHVDDLLEQVALPTGTRTTRRLGASAADGRHWQAPAAARNLLPTQTAPPRQPYPLPVSEGRHILDVEACLGSIAQLGDAGAGTLLDLHQLRGLRITLAPDTGACPAGTQSAHVSALSAQQSLF